MKTKFKSLLFILLISGSLHAQVVKDFKGKPLGSYHTMDDEMYYISFALEDSIAIKEMIEINLESAKRCGGTKKNAYFIGKCKYYRAEKARTGELYGNKIKDKNDRVFLLLIKKGKRRDKYFISFCGEAKLPIKELNVYWLGYIQKNDLKSFVRSNKPFRKKIQRLLLHYSSKEKYI